MKIYINLSKENTSKYNFFDKDGIKIRNEILLYHYDIKTIHYIIMFNIKWAVNNHKYIQLCFKYSVFYLENGILMK